MNVNLELLFLLPDLIFAFSLALSVSFTVLSGVNGLYALPSGKYPKLHSLAAYQLLVTVIFALLVKAQLFYLHGTAFGSAFSFSGVSNLAQLLTLALGLLVYVYVFTLEETQTLEFWIFSTLFLYANYALVASSDLLLAFLLFELQSFNSYALIALARHRVLSLEAALKYFLLGTVGSIFFLLSVALVYFFLGTTSVTDIFLLSISLEQPYFVVFAMVPVISAILLKLSAFPFHMWAPDVYGVLRTPVLLAFSVLPKLAFWAFFLVAILPILIATKAFLDSSFIFYLGVAGIVFGSLAAFRQPDLRRFVAYSGVANMGYCVCALLTGSGLSYFAVLLYAISYSIVAMLFILVAGHPSLGELSLNALKARVVVNPIVGFIMSLVLLTLAGFPPFIGFFAKYSVIVSLWGSNFGYYSALLAFITTLGAVYYVVLAADVYFYPAKVSTGVVNRPADFGSARSLLLALLLLVNCFWIFVYPLVEAALRYAILS